MSKNAALILGLLLVLFAGCQQSHTAQKQNAGLSNLPAPSTDVAEEQEESEDNQERLRRWIEQMYGDIEIAPQDRQAALDLSTNRPPIQILPSGNETFAGGLIHGRWEERGANNQAGSIHEVCYVPELDVIYAFGAEVVNTIGGRSLWKGDRDGNWTLLNDDYFLEPAILEAFYPSESNTLRLISATGRTPVFSDDDGQSWTEAGITFNGSSGQQHSIGRVPGAPDTLFYLARTPNNSGNNRIQLYRSNDAGESYQLVLTTTESSSSRVSMWAPETGDTVFVLEGGHTMHFLTANGINSVATTGLSTNGDTGLCGSLAGGLTIYALMDDNAIYKSNNGTNWSFVNNTPINAWAVGMRCSPNTPDKLFVGGVNFYFSYDGGQNWELANEWWEYYGNIDLLHADIMDMEFGQTTEGQDFLLVANHGGLHVSYDDLQTTLNLGKQGLNVGQYYDVITNPDSPDHIYVGTQDQGWQWTGDADSPGVLDMDQHISGDYGHLRLTQNNQSFWTQYPGASFAYRNDAFNPGSSDASYNVNGNHIRYWIVGTAPFKADPAANAILVAGGDVNEGNGSHVITLEATTSEPFEISASQFDYDFRANSHSGSANVSAIEQPVHDIDTIYVSTSDGTFFRSTNGGATWIRTENSQGPSVSWIYSSSILSSKLDPQKIWMSGSASQGAPVYQSTDGGNSFQPIGNGLPMRLTQELVTDPEERFLFAATSIGPYVYVIAEDQWYPLIGTDTPINWYTSVEYIEPHDIVRFSTFGRGVWDLVLDMVQPVNPNNYSITNGTYESGNLQDLFESDDTYLSILSAVDPKSNGSIAVTFFGNIGDREPDSLSIQLESTANTPGLEQKIEAFNWTTGEFDQVDVRNQSFDNDLVTSVDLGDNAGDFVDATGNVLVIARWESITPTLMFPWQIRIDQLNWQVQ